MTIPEGVNESNLQQSPSSAWQFLPDNRTTHESGAFRVLFVESYGAGSHWRIARILQQQSRHRMDIIRLARDHWRTIALVGHRAILDAIDSVPTQRPDAVVFSGPADFRQVKAQLPTAWDALPIAAYFHESQWTYPADSMDRLPHLVNHLETLEACDGAWFNSRYHRDTFYATAWNHTASMVRSLARNILPDHWHKAEVISPPVHVAQRPVTRAEDLTISWSARWERDKRPDIMLEVVGGLLSQGLNLRLHILGCDRDQWEAIISSDDALRAVVQPQSGYLPRDEYETVLAASDIWLSTAEHEYFGVSALEAALLGATPLVPDRLAYSETIPSAINYPAGNTEAATRRINEIRQHVRPLRGPWMFDAWRYRAATSVARFDLAVEKLVARF